MLLECQRPDILSLLCLFEELPELELFHVHQLYKSFAGRSGAQAALQSLSPQRCLIQSVGLPKSQSQRKIYFAAYKHRPFHESLAPEHAFDYLIPAKVILAVGYCQQFSNLNLMIQLFLPVLVKCQDISFMKIPMVLCLRNILSTSFCKSPHNFFCSRNQRYDQYLFILLQFQYQQLGSHTAFRDHAGTEADNEIPQKLIQISILFLRNNLSIHQCPKNQNLNYSSPIQSFFETLIFQQAFFFQFLSICRQLIRIRQQFRILSLTLIIILILLIQMQPMLSPRVSNLLTTTLTYLPQITEKLQKFEEQNLQRLDDAVTKYAEKRNQLKKPILDDLQEQTLSIQNLNIANLNILHNQSECAIMKLNQEISKFEQTKQSIQQLNHRLLKEFINNDDYNEVGYMLDICKKLIIELSNYRDIDDIVNNIQEQRKKNKYYQRDHDIVADVEDYLSKVARVMSQDEDDDDGLYPVNRTQSSRSAMLLEFIE